MENPIRISPKKFTEEFYGVVQDAQNQLVDLWFQSARYTKLMYDLILPAVAERIGLLSWPRPYYHLDSVFYQEKDTDNFQPPVENAKYIAVAIEHEHVLSGSAQEMNKLQLFNAPLKVLITYDMNDVERAKYLRIYEAIIASADVFEDIVSLRRQLVLIGRLIDRQIGWSAYTYERTGFVAV